MKKVILFDFWGTLVENGVWSPIKQVKKILNIKAPFSEYVVRMERAMMTRTFVSLKDAFLAVGEEFALTPTERQIEELVGMWNKSWMLAKPYEELLQTLVDLRKDYRLVLLSNTDCFSVPKVLEKFSLSQYFDREFLSYEVGHIKTDKHFFSHVFEQLEVAPEDCVMIGDSIQSDMMAAQRMNVKAILIDRRDTRDFMQKITQLDQLRSILE